MSTENWSLDQIRSAFWKAFHEEGEVWFDYLSSPDQNDTSTLRHWETLLRRLKPPSAARAGIASGVLAQLKAELKEAEDRGDIPHKKAAEIAGTRAEIDAFNREVDCPSGDCFLIDRMRAAGLKDPQISAALQAIRNTCPRCWSRPAAGCRCHVA